MRCDQIKKLLPVYLDGALESQETQSVKDHLASCVACQKEREALERSWAMLGQWQKIDPAPGYVSRFWTRVSLEPSWRERVAGGIREAVEGVRRKRLAPVFAAACVLMIAGIFSLRNYLQMREARELLSSLSQEELEMAEDIELAENFEIIENLDVLEDLEIIENLDSLET